MAATVPAKNHNESLDDFRWRMFMGHQPNSTFFVGVKTTKIFCLSDCPARRARRANVVFFDDTRQAMAKGFRACKRCKPLGGEDEKGEQHARRRAAVKAKQVILRHGGKVSWRDVCKEVGLSERYMFESFKTVVGLTPGVWAETVRKEEGQVDDRVSSLALNASDTSKTYEPEFNFSDWISWQEWRECLDGLEQDESSPMNLATAPSLSSGTTIGTPYSSSDTRTLQGEPHDENFDDWLLAGSLIGSDEASRTSDWPAEAYTISHHP